MFRKVNSRHYDRTNRFLEFVLEIKADLDDSNVDSAQDTLDAFAEAIKSFQRDILVADRKFFIITRYYTKHVKVLKKVFEIFFKVLGITRVVWKGKDFCITPRKEFMQGKFKDCKFVCKGKFQLLHAQKN